MRIAVFGRIRSGKSQVGEYIKNYLFNEKNQGCELYEFSQAVQSCVEILYPNLKGIKDREKLVSVGQHLRKLDEDIWVNIVKHNILNSSSDNILVVGVRQENEFKMLEELGFTFIKVEANEDIRIFRSKLVGDKNTTNLLNNETELLIDDYKEDYLISNEEDLAALKNKTYSLIGELMK